MCRKRIWWTVPPDIAGLEVSDQSRPITSHPRSPAIVARRAKRPTIRSVPRPPHSCGLRAPQPSGTPLAASPNAPPALLPLPSDCARSLLAPVPPPAPPLHAQVPATRFTSGDGAHQRPQTRHRDSSRDDPKQSRPADPAPTTRARPPPRRAPSRRPLAALPRSADKRRTVRHVIGVGWGGGWEGAGGCAARRAPFPARRRLPPPLPVLAARHSPFTLPQQDPGAARARPAPALRPPTATLVATTTKAIASCRSRAPSHRPPRAAPSRRPARGCPHYPACRPHNVARRGWAVGRRAASE